MSVQMFNIADVSHVWYHSVRKGRKQLINPHCIHCWFYWPIVLMYCWKYWGKAIKGALWEDLFPKIIIGGSVGQFLSRAHRWCTKLPKAILEKEIDRKGRDTNMWNVWGQARIEMLEIPSEKKTAKERRWESRSLNVISGYPQMFLVAESVVHFPSIISLLDFSFFLFLCENIFF